MTRLEDEIAIVEVVRGTERYEALISLAAEIHSQRDAVDRTFRHALESHVFGARRSAWNVECAAGASVRRCRRGQRISHELRGAIRHNPRAPTADGRQPTADD